MESYNLATLTHIVQSCDRERSQAALEEVKRRGFDYEELHEQFNG